MCKISAVNSSPPGGWGPVVAASAIVQLPIGKRVEWTTSEWDSLLLGTGSWVQKLGGNDYMVQQGVVASTVVEGTDGLLMIDCPVLGENFYNHLVDTFGDMPFAAIALTHGHSDHSGGMAYFRDKFPNVRVIGTEYLDHFVRQRELNTAMVPTEIVYGHDGSFDFDGHTFRMVTPDVTGHSGADSYVVTPSRTLHIVDMVDPQRLNHVNW
jgi:glyoxylase-like metal-dependent hydrolase (beta-lactamase superfamily II)